MYFRDENIFDQAAEQLFQMTYASSTDSNGIELGGLSRDVINSSPTTVNTFWKRFSKLWKRVGTIKTVYNIAVSLYSVRELVSHYYEYIGCDIVLAKSTSTYYPRCQVVTADSLSCSYFNFDSRHSNTTCVPCYAIKDEIQCQQGSFQYSVCFSSVCAGREWLFVYMAVRIILSLYNTYFNSLRIEKKIPLHVMISRLINSVTLSFIFLSLSTQQIGFNSVCKVLLLETLLDVLYDGLVIWYSRVPINIFGFSHEFCLFPQ